MSRLINELKDKKVKNLFNPSDEINNDMKLLMESNEQKTKNVLSNVGVDGALQAAQTKKGFDIERKNLEEKYNSELIFTQAEIKELCLEYRLKFLKASRYIGPIDSELGEKLGRLSDEHKLDLENSKGRADDFFVAAPYNCFKLDWVPKPPKDPDPLMFYCVEKDYQNPDNSKYLLVHKWGSDFTPLRLIKGFIFKNGVNWFFSNLFIWSFIMSLIPAYKGATFGPMLLLSVVLGFAATIALAIAHWGDEGSPAFGIKSWSLKLSDEGWNSKTRN